MGFLDRFKPSDQPQPLRGAGLTLRFPVLDDYRAWAELRRESRAFLKPWEPDWPDDDLTFSSYKRRVRRYRELAGDDLCFPYFIFSDENRLVGAVTLSNVRRGVAQMATLGYWIGEAHVRQGHMTHALQVLLPFCFAELGFNRIEAACLPRNEASVRLLAKTGFEREGYARNYLRIAGTWEDHLLYARRRGEAVSPLRQ